MVVPMFKITISWDEEKKVFIPEFQETIVGEKLDRHDKVGIIEDCVRVITKAIRSTPKEGE